MKIVRDPSKSSWKKERKKKKNFRRSTKERDKENRKKSSMQISRALWGLRGFTGCTLTPRDTSLFLCRSTRSWLDGHLMSRCELKSPTAVWTLFSKLRVRRYSELHSPATSEQCYVKEFVRSVECGPHWGPYFVTLCPQAPSSRTSSATARGAKAREQFCPVWTWHYERSTRRIRFKNRFNDSVSYQFVLSERARVVSPFPSLSLSLSFSLSLSQLYIEIHGSYFDGGNTTCYVKRPWSPWPTLTATNENYNLDPL